MSVEWSTKIMIPGSNAVEDFMGGKKKNKKNFHGAMEDRNGVRNSSNMA